MACPRCLTDSQSSCSYSVEKYMSIANVMTLQHDNLMCRHQLNCVNREVGLYVSKGECNSQLEALQHPPSLMLETGICNKVSWPGEEN